jgi:hypothetical protein
MSDAELHSSRERATMRKTRWIFAAAPAIAAMLFATLFATPAHADQDQDFLNMLQSFGDFSMGPWDNNVIFLPMGRQTCTDIQNGVTPQAAADYIVQHNLIPPWTPLEAHQVVAAAQQTLCPNTLAGNSAPWPVFYHCDNPQSDLSVVFYKDQQPPGAQVSWNGIQALVQQQPSASGIHYVGDGVDYTEDQGQINVNFQGTQLNCTRT